jgi:hypothetical protein
LWTVREGELLDQAVEYCRQRGLEFYAVNKNYPEEVWDDTTPRKLTADMWIDDRNLGGLPDWGIIYRMVKYNESSADAARYLGNQPEEPKKKGLFSFLRK